MEKKLLIFTSITSFWMDEKYHKQKTTTNRLYFSFLETFCGTVQDAEIFFTIFSVSFGL